MNYTTLKQQLAGLVACAAITICLPTLAFAVPGQVSQQGRIVDDAGAGLSGSHAIEFTLFSDSAGNTPVWSESHTVDLDDGYYSVILGADTSNPLDDTVLSLDSLYLGMTVDSGTPMQPLLEVTSAPYAILADLATNLDGGYADANSIYIDGTLVVDGNGDWVGNTLPGTLASLGCADGEQARYTSASGWTCINPGTHFTSADAVSAMGTEGNSNALNHARYSNTDAIAAMGAAGSTNSLNHAPYNNSDAISAMGAAGTGNTYNHARYSDSEAVAAVGAANSYVSADGNGDVVISNDLDLGGNQTIGAVDAANHRVFVTAGQNNIASLEAYGTGGNQGSGVLYVGQSIQHGGGLMYNGDDTPAMEGTIDNISFYRRSSGTDHQVMSYPHHSDTVTFEGEVRSQCPSGTFRVADFCIEDAVNSAEEWRFATLGCHNKGMRLCSLAVLMACDLLGAEVDTSSTTDCVDRTDNTGAWTWTSDTAPYTSNPFNVFGYMLAYKGNNDADAKHYEDDYGYYCCTQAWGG